MDDDDAPAEVAPRGYAWEARFERSWEQIQEDPRTGRLKSTTAATQRARKARRDDGLRGVRRGMIRYAVLVVDLSTAMAATDWSPSRGEAVAAAADAWVRAFFDENPISQLAVVALRDGVAELLTTLSSSPRAHTDALAAAVTSGCYGDASLENGVRLAAAVLAPIPAYGSREVLVLFGGLATCDPGDVRSAIDGLAADGVRASVVGIDAEVYILSRLASVTGGTYTVATAEVHFGELLASHVTPPPTVGDGMPPTLVRMGFPVLRSLPAARPALDDNLAARRVGYVCPRCEAWIAHVPAECVLCGLTLVSSPHLARSYHHLFPVAKFSERPAAAAATASPTDGTTAATAPAAKTVPRSAGCYGCGRALRGDVALRLECARCGQDFCLDCDTYVHESLHNCPGCEVAGIEQTSLLMVGEEGGGGVPPAMVVDAGAGAEGVGGGAGRASAGSR
ncbi:hypothetical protein MMPV_007701 [Pyropia vietnamensis]